jgi:hypothetical protein
MMICINNLQNANSKSVHDKNIYSIVLYREIIIYLYIFLSGGVYHIEFNC